MTTPLESIESTVTRLRAKVGPHGYHADEIARLKVKLEEAHTALGNDAVELKQWEKILDTLRADKRDLEQFKEEFLRRHPAAEEVEISLYTGEEEA